MTIIALPIMSIYVLMSQIFIIYSTANNVNICINVTNIYHLFLFLHTLHTFVNRLYAVFSPCIQPSLYIKILENTITPIDSMTKSQFTQSHIFIDPKQTDTIQAILYKQYRSFDIIHLP